MAGVMQKTDGVMSDGAEAQRLASEAPFHALFTSMQEMVVLHELMLDAAGQPVDYRILDCNPAFTIITGISREQAVGALASALYGGGSAPYLQAYAQVVQTGLSESFEVFFAPMKKHFIISALRYAPGCFATVTLDITERRQMEDALKRSREEWEDIFQAIGQPTAILDPLHGIIAANRALLSISGKTLEELRGLKCWQIFHGPTATAPVPECPVELVLRSGVQEFAESEIPALGGTYLVSCTPVKNVDGNIEKIIHIATDVTEFKRLHQAFLQAQKIETVGKLAGGVAHDFNNILQAILGACELLLARTPPGDERRRELQEIVESGERAAGLTRQLLAFSRKQILSPRLHDLNMIITAVGRMLARLIGEDVALKLELTPNIRKVRVDGGQMEQVLMNLAVNARDAMPKGGQFVIRTSNLVLTPEDLVMNPEGRPGAYVCMDVTDNGCGMSREVQAQIFEPFFTTKPQGKGTGLGLATVHGIIKQHGGWTTVYSEPGLGTTFKIYLPAAEESGRRPTPVVEDVIRPGNQENILVIEDEPHVRRLVCVILSQHGYRVTDVGSCAEARAVFQNSFDLVFSDVILPDGNGLEMMQEFQEQQSGFRCVLTSGYADIHERWPEIEKHGWVFLHKPFSKASLLRTIAAAISPS